MDKNKKPTIEELTAELAQEKAKSAHLKNLLDRALSEKAHWKRVLKDYQEGEQKKDGTRKEKDEEIFKLHKELEAMHASKQFIEMGMREQTAIETARAFLEGDSEKFHDYIEAHIREVQKTEQDKAARRFLAENHTEVHAGFGDSGYSSAENIALKHVRNIEINKNDLKNFE